MRNRFTLAMIAFVAGVVVSLGVNPAAGQASYKAPRAADGHADLSGIWQAVGTAHWDLEPHTARPSPVVALGAVGAVPAGTGVIEGGNIPYQPWALAKKKENAANSLTLDPEVKCFLPGVPRATYMPFPFQIVQTPKFILIGYEFASASRLIYMDNHDEAPVDSWMGWSQGRWEGDTLVVDVTGFNDKTWFDRAGNFHSEALHVVERYSRIGPDHIMYEATIEDPKVFTRPWKIGLPLYRRLEKNLQLLEFKCVALVEELIYGPLRKQPSK